MTDLSMSMFVNKADFLRAQADLRQQEQERVQVTVTPQAMTTTRLVCGVELALKESGKRWTLSARKV